VRKSALREGQFLCDPPGFEVVAGAAGLLEGTFAGEAGHQRAASALLSRGPDDGRYHGTALVR